MSLRVQYPEYEEDDTKSLLKTKLGVDVVEGTLSDYDEDENVVTIGNKEYKVAEGVSVKALLNNYVSAWKLNGKIVYVKAESNTIYEYVTANKVSNGKVTEITVKFADKKYKVKEDAEIKLNGEVIAEARKDDLKGTYGKIVLDDNKVIYADLYEMNYISAAKVVSVDADDEVVEYYKEDPDSVLKLRLEDKDVTVIKNNKAAKLEDLKKGDVISVYRSDDRESFVIVATDAELEGKLTAVREEDRTYKVRIDGTYYKIDSPFLSKDGGDSFVSFGGEDSLDDFFGEKVVAYKDYKGDIVYIVAEVEEKTTTFLGIITKAWRTDNTYVKVFKADGTVATYVYDDDYFDLDDLDYDKETVFEFEIDEDGVVQSIKALTPVDIVNETVKFDEDEEAVTVSGAVYYVGSKTVFFDATGDDADDLDVIKWDKIKGLTGSGISAKVYLNAKNEIRAMVFTDGLDSIGKDDTFYAFVADKVRSGSNKYTLTLETADDEMDVVFDSAKLKEAQINDIVKVKMLKDGKGEIKGVYRVEDIETTYIVKDKDGSRYIRLAENEDDTGTWYKVDNKVLVYDATDEDEYEKVSMNHIAKYDKVKVVIDVDGNNVVKAIFLVEE